MKSEVVNQPEKVIGFAIIDSISLAVVATKETIEELEKLEPSLERTAYFKDEPVPIYEIVQRGDKNYLGKQVKLLNP